MKALTLAFQENPEFQQLQQHVKHEKGVTHVWGMDKRITPLLMEGLSSQDRFKLIVTYEERRAREIVEDYRFYNRQTYYYPAKDALFYYADIHSNNTVQQRLEISKRIAQNKPCVVVVSIEGLMDKIPPLSYMQDNIITLQVGGKLNPETFSRKLTTLGYEKTSIVETPGQFSVRGGIIDIFSLTEECPYRVELWDDDIDSIRSFEVESQRSMEHVEEFVVYPASEMILDDERIHRGITLIEKEHKAQAKTLKEQFRTEQYARLNKMVASVMEELKEFNSTMGVDSMVQYFYEETVSFMDYFPTHTDIFIDDPERVAKKADVYATEFRMSMEGRLEGGYVLPTQADVLYDCREILAKLMTKTPLLISELYKKQLAWKEQAAFSITAKGLASYQNSFEELMKDILRYKKNKYRIVILSPSATRGKRIASNLQDYDIPAYFTENRENPLLEGEVRVSVGRMETGFEIPQCHLLVIAEGDIFTAKELKSKKKKPKYSGEKIGGFSDLSVGDYVVHQNHGVGIYRGIDKVETDGRMKDYISIEYAKGSKLFIPVEQLDKIGKLSGKESAKPKLNRLGGPEWEKVRTRVRGHVEDIAKELVELYAVRSSQEGFQYSPDTIWQREFEELFPYEETLDQQKAIDDTKHDMESGKIMDRLVCGDVGFGKTEVAIRAAFKAVQDNRQVAYLVPTTILAEQHYNTFVERMKNYPVEIRMLSRFCTPKQIKQTIEELKTGRVDIVIGTHRLLSKDVAFKSLGLLIIDEEQRFGVKHKEQIKQMKNNVDVLTLTATPIPRTLHMSLVGLRDISLLEEPPVDRLPIQTYIMEYDLEFVKEAINRELTRNGQVYYVYNRVETIADIAVQLRQILPDARVEYAHGKMPERQLEEIMRDFIHGEIDVLVSTTIIETGLDIPNVNTIIIHDADRFGLSQLYQLRGRVGRSNRSAYAFLLYKRDKMIKEVAEKRLKAIREFTDLGSGYKIAMKDLEIRGAGNLLGQEQSGNIEAVGYDLYCQMLNDAIRKLSGETLQEDFVTNVDLPLNAYIPDSYVKNEYVKLDLYKRISKSQSREDNDEILEEVRDRFGEPDKCFFRLLDVAYLKAYAHSLYVTDIKYVMDEVRFVMLSSAPVQTERIKPLLKKYKGKLKLVAAKQTYFSIRVAKTIEEELIHVCESVLDDIRTLF